jgi:hypothetical protein
MTGGIIGGLLRLKYKSAGSFASNTTLQVNAFASGELASLAAN